MVLSVGAGQPVDFALRNAVEDLTQFDDYEEVLKEFAPSTYRQYMLDDSLYALPETLFYNVMFYRKDVLEDLELEVPQTWKELIEMLPTIQGNNLSVGIPTAAGSSGALRQVQQLPRHRQTFQCISHFCTSRVETCTMIRGLRQ